MAEAAKHQGEMKSFVLKVRKTSALEEKTVEAATREEAIAEVLEEAEEGEEIEVTSAVEAPADEAATPSGAKAAAHKPAAHTEHKK